MKLRLVNRSNLGIERIYTALLVEGKEPPLIEDLGEVFRLTLRASELSPSFRVFVSEVEKQGIYLGVDHLLILQYLLRHAEIESFVWPGFVNVHRYKPVKSCRKWRGSSATLTGEEAAGERTGLCDPGFTGRWSHREILVAIEGLIGRR